MSYIVGTGRQQHRRACGVLSRLSAGRAATGPEPLLLLMELTGQAVPDHQIGAQRVMARLDQLAQLIDRLICEHPQHPRESPLDWLDPFLRLAFLLTPPV